MTARILVADDEQDIRQLIVFTLKRRGYELIEAAAGDAALELALRERPGLAILDVMMPGMTGFEVASALRADARTADMPIVMLSARGQAGEVAEGLSSGATTYLVKPFAPRQLADLVAEALAARDGAAGSEP